MSFGYGVGDIMAVSRLALKVYTAYKDAPDDYRNIADEAKSLHIIIEEAPRHFESTTLSNKKQQRGKEVLEGCQNVLKDLDALIEKYNALAPANANTSQVFRRIRLGTEDIVTLRARLTSNTTLLNSFIQRLDIATITINITIEYIMLISQRSCDSHKLDELRAQLDKLVLRRTSSRGSLVSLVSLAGSINTKKVYRNFCKGLFESGVTAEMIKGKEKEIHNMFKPPNATTSSQIDASTNADQSRLPKGCNPSDSETLAPLPTISTESDQNRLRFPRILPPVDFLVGPLMLDAAEAGDIKRLKSTLGYVRNINFVDNTRDTALHKAASGGYNDIVQLLLSKGASIEATNTRNNTPLSLAVRYGQTSTVGLLLSKGASIDVTDKNNNTPLHCAASRGYTSTMELLLTKGALIEATNKGGNTPFHLAAGYDRTSIVELLLSRGVSIEATNKDNNTPLHLAAKYSSNTRIVELLLSKGASIEAMNDYHDTPLQFARRYKNTSVVELLLSNGASIEATNDDNCTPLQFARLRRGNTRVVELLERAEATNSLEIYKTERRR